MKIPPEQKPEELTVKVDTREQWQLDVSPMKVEIATLPEGDYTIRGCESEIIVERKSLGDLVACCGGERERFTKEVRRLLSYPARLLVVESDWPTIERGEWRGKITPQVVTGSLLSWMSLGLPVCLAGSHEQAGRYVARFLFLAARHRYRQCRALLAGVEVES